jgi:hypothetical protein
MAKIFSSTAEQDRLYALGWPHLRRLVDKHKLDKKPEETARGVLDDPDPPSQFGVEWPRETAARIVRAFAESPKSNEWDAALAKAGPITPEEARALVDRVVNTVAVRPQLSTADFLLLLEAHVGSDVATDVLISRFERWQLKDWTADTLRHAFLTAMVAPVALTAGYYLGFFLLRVSDPMKKKFRSRAETLLKRSPPDWPVHVAIDLALHGGEAVRSNRLRALCACHHVVDDPQLVRQLAQHDEHVLSLSPRFVFLGGHDMLDHYAERAKALPRWIVMRFAEEFGTIKHPKNVPIMLTLSQKKTAKDVPIKWFVENEEMAKPIVEEIALRKSPQGEAARAILEQLKQIKIQAKIEAQKAKEAAKLAKEQAKKAPPPKPAPKPKKPEPKKPAPKPAKKKAPPPKKKTKPASKKSGKKPNKSKAKKRR